MAKTQYLDLTGLTTYDEKIKEYIDSKDGTIVTNLTNGTTVVKTAQNATTANSATTANTATSATTATKLGSSDVGSSSRPIYLSKGTATGVSSVGITYGGTGSTTADGARTNLGVYSTSEVDSKLSGKASSTHNHDTAYDAKGAAASAETNAKAYADGIKNDLLNGAGDAYDTLKELGDLIDTNANAIDALETVASGKADKNHTHTIANVTGLQDALNGKAASSHGTHVTFDSTNKPKMDGTAAFGTSTNVARADHVHPTDTTRASQSDLDALTATVSGKADSGHTHSVVSSSANGFMSTAMYDKLSGIAAGANKTTVDSALSSTSTNPVQNKVVKAELDKKATTTALSSVSSVANEAKSAAAANTSAISANTDSINTHTSQILALQGLVGDGFEAIPNEDITALFTTAS